MATDCEKLSANAQEIFDKLEPFFPPDPWKKPRWEKEGIVHDNGTFDLRKSVDRKTLEEKTRRTVGCFVETTAGVYKQKNGHFEGFEIDHFGMATRKTIELLFILKDLDFQIETMDLVES